MQKPTVPKGTRDFNPITSARRDFLINIINQQFQKYGFQKIETPAMENLSVLTGKYGDEGDQLLFKVLNSGDYLKQSTVDDFEQGSKNLLGKIAEKGLRYDLTVPFARYVAMNQNEIAFPFKRYQIQPVWRADRPQRGRYREFVQCDADIIGSNSIWAEAELTLLIHDVFEELGLNGYVLKINHREVLFGLARWLGLSGKEVPFCTIVDKLDKVSKEIVIGELRELNPHSDQLTQLDMLLENRATSSANDLTNLQSIIEGNEGLEFVKKYFAILDDFKDRKFKVEFDWTLARGLSYYTGLIYEAKATTVKMGSILGGGRYDNLTGMFGLPEMSGVGISFGIDRIYDVMNELNLFPERLASATRALLTHFDEETFRHSYLLLDQLRAAGIAADSYPDRAKIKKQMSFANKTGVPYVITVGQEEIETGLYSLKEMKTGEIQKLPLDKLLEKLRD